MVLILLLGRIMEIEIAQVMEEVVLGRSELSTQEAVHKEAILASAWLVPELAKFSTASPVSLHHIAISGG